MAELVVARFLVLPAAVLLGQALDHEGASPPAAPFPRHGDADARLDLLGLAEIVVHRVDEAGSDNLDEALVAFGIRPLVDREGKMSGADQARRRGPGGDHRGQALAIVLRIAAHRAIGGDIVRDQQLDRPVGARLQRQDAVELEHRGDRRGENDEFAEPRRDGVGIVVPAEDGIDRRAQPHQPAAQPVRLDLEGLNEVVAATGPGDPVRTHSRHQARMPFCACRRFSASSNTTERGPSMTPSVTSSPRWAGRQCMKIASGPAAAIRRSST